MVVTVYYNLLYIIYYYNLMQGRRNRGAEGATAPQSKARGGLPRKVASRPASVPGPSAYAE